jgi:hypothetical protein
MCIRRIVDRSVVHLKIAVQKAPMKRATLLRAHEIWISYVVVSVHPRIMSRAEGVNVGAKQRIVHRERLPQGLEQVCSRTDRRSASDSASAKNKGASAVTLLRPLKLSRKVFRLPGSIWGEDNPVVHGRQSGSYANAVQNCGQVCKIPCPEAMTRAEEDPADYQKLSPSAAPV